MVFYIHVSLGNGLSVLSPFHTGSNMFCIKTNEDINRLRKTQSLDGLYLDHIERFFLQLFDELSDTDDVDEFSLDDYGYMVILQAGDNVRDLKEVEPNPEDNGLAF